MSSEKNGRLEANGGDTAQSYDDMDEDENVERGNWDRKLDFILSSIGYAVGLGNVWRFPYLCYKNGGGAFLIPYTIMLFAAGMPLYTLELGFGQFISKGCVGVWAVTPLFRGIGYAMVIISIYVCIYYNMILAYTIFYLFASFSKVMPWSDCDNYWNTDTCYVHGRNKTLDTMMVEIENVTRPSQEFWDNYVLGRSEGLHEMGSVKWQLALCLLLAWIIVCMCLIKGVKSVGKVVYFTATFPYIVLFILLIRGVTLPGAIDGIIYYVKPNFSKLRDANVWKDAAVQIFYSLGPAWGGIHTLASYNKFHNNFRRDGVIISLVNCGTSIFAGFVVFSVVGFMAHDSGLDVSKVADSGPGLAFVVYPEALARMPGSTVWSLLFFFMLLTLGLDTMFVTVETVISAICDEGKEYIPTIYEKKLYITIGVCAVFFLLGLPQTTNGGIYLLTLMDNYSAGFSLLLVAMLEAIIVSYVYGINKFLRDMSIMLGYKMSIYWKVCWMVLAPFIIGFIFIFFIVSYEPLTYQEYTYTSAGDALGWLMVAAAVMPIPVWIVYFMITQSQGDSFSERLRYSITPANDWGPALDKHRLESGYQIFGDYSDAEPQTFSKLMQADNVKS